MEILLNKDYGGYNLSFYAKTEILKKKGVDFYVYQRVENQRFYEKATFIHAVSHSEDLSYNSVLVTDDYGDIVSYGHKAFFEDADKMKEIFKSRTDKDIIDVVKKLSEDANGPFSKIVVIEIPDDCFYEIVDYDGVETVFYSKTEIKRA